MTDELERQLDEFYRGLDDPARRLQSRWKAPAPKASAPRRSPPLAWFAAALASASAAALVIFSLAPREQPELPKPGIARRTDPLPALTPPAPAPDKRPVEVRPTPTPAPTPHPDPKPAPVKPKPAPAPKPVVVPPAPKKKEEPDPPPATTPPPPKSTRIEAPSLVFTETRGTFDLGERRLRGTQKKIRVTAPSTLRTSTTVRLELGTDRVLLVRARSRMNLVPRTDRLDVVLESGEVLAELRAPGPEIRVITPTCEVTPMGTVFSVRVERGKAVVLVEESRVSCRSGEKTVEIPAGHGLAVSRKGELGVPMRADFRALAWARAQRPAVLPLFEKTFDVMGKWKADPDQGAALGRKDASYGLSRVDLESHPPKPPIFRIPVRGRIVVTCKFERSADLIVVINNSTQGHNFRFERSVTAPGQWRTETFDLADFFTTIDEFRGAKLKPGDEIGHFSIQAEYGENMKRFWVRDVRVEAIR